MRETPPPAASPVRLVTFLGLGDEKKWPERYQPVRYRLETTETEATPHHDLAALLHFRDRVQGIIVLGTPQVREAWFTPSGSTQQGRYEESLARGIHPLPPVAFQEIPSRLESKQHLWELFQAVVSCLGPEPLSLQKADGAPWSEPAAPGEILFDITHGYRVSSFFAATAVAFARSQQRRARASQFPRLRILYAALPADAADFAEVWDVSHFIEVLDWDAAIDDLMRHGRGDGLEKLARDRQKQKHQAERQPSKWTKLGQASRGFADALATVRVSALLTEAAGRLEDAIQETRDEVVRDVPLLVPQLQVLRQWASELKAERAVSREGVQAVLRLVTRYLELERYAEATSVLRETLVSLATLLRHGNRRAVHQPGEKGIKSQREEVERSLGEAAMQSRSRPTDTLAAEIQPPSSAPATSPHGWPPSLLRLWDAVVQLRNDMLHAGFNESPSDAGRLRKDVEKWRQETAQVLNHLLPEDRRES